jgi:hypothetical protein
MLMFHPMALHPGVVLDVVRENARNGQVRARRRPNT